MRIVETCSCGAQLEVSWAELSPHAHSGEYREFDRSRAKLATFRKNHKPCRTQPAALVALAERQALALDCLSRMRDDRDNLLNYAGMAQFARRVLAGGAGDE